MSEEFLLSSWIIADCITDSFQKIVLSQGWMLEAKTQQGKIGFLSNKN